MRKRHIVDEVEEFQEDEVEFLRQEPIKSWKQDYHVMSIIGSQSSGKSTLLNELFNFGFDVLNRQLASTGSQTTKGIWMAVDEKLKMVVLDVEGSDSKEREDSRNNVERMNSLFALAISNSLMVNIWQGQIGLWRGSQLEILETVLELNLRLFKSERPKQIIFVIRDFQPDRKRTEEEQKEQIRITMISKVQAAWNKVEKPPGTQNIKLEELFLLKIFFLPNLFEEKQLFQQQVTVLRESLIKIAHNPTLIEKNVLMENMPKYLKNLWDTIKSNKDLNLPAEKILIANLRCNEIRKQAFQKIEEHFNRVIDKATHSFNPKFAEEIGELVDEALHYYDKQTQFYPKEEVSRIRDEFVKDVEHSIFASFKAQVGFLSAECITEVTKKLSDAGTRGQKNDNSIQKLNEIRSSAEDRFRNDLSKVAYRSVWVEEVSKEFVRDLAKAVEVSKNKILMDYLSYLDKHFKKTIDVKITGLLNNKLSFTKKGFFWDQLKKEFEILVNFAHQGIQTRLDSLELGNKSSNKQYFEKSKIFCYSELKTKATNRIKDINNYLMLHFKNQFNFESQNVPRSWPDIEEQKIDQLYKNARKELEDSLSEFERFGLAEISFDEIEDNQLEVRRNSSFQKLTSSKSDRPSKSILLQEWQILSSDKIEDVKKNFNEMAEQELKDAKRKHNDKYKGNIPKWMLVLLGVFMIDDVLLWFSSPALIIPVTIIGILIAVAVHKFGMGPTRALLGQATNIGSGLIGNLTKGNSAPSKKNE